MQDIYHLFLYFHNGGLHIKFSANCNIFQKAYLNQTLFYHYLFQTLPQTHNMFSLLLLSIPFSLKACCYVQE